MVREMGGADLPWGWWLRSSRGALEDEQGRRWHTVRDAYWHGHLRFPPDNGTSEQQELLLRVLCAFARRGSYGTETMHDLLGGDLMFWRFYQCWLGSVGLLDVDGRQPVFGAPLSTEGRSVMLMLQATREPAWIDLPFTEIVEAVARGGRDAADDERESTLRAFERSVARRPHVFARERVGRHSLVTLTGIGLGGRMPLRRVMWSHPFASSRTRDDFYAWLAERVDRWEAWGELAYGSGASALTQRLLTLFLETGGRPS
ncbi:hypothetical protein [Sphingomonas melonis]|uniref:Uncharacterized protein n=1 Tax=Sphingomonas melonis TaxID=152682 RepID=A0A7Y9FN55_9SPHN|nr:hypothetical protein [Sphingomonas melonis]NYD89176.1 hypothetical protein [Sphingomonas melonis]